MSNERACRLIPGSELPATRPSPATARSRTFAAATIRIEAQGLPPLPNVTPHTMRRTYLSIALLANGFDVKWVISQVGHADSKMTLDVYDFQERKRRRLTITKTLQTRTFPTAGRMREKSAIP
jgi:integrase